MHVASIVVLLSVLEIPCRTRPPLQSNNLPLHSLWTCWTTSNLMGAVKTEGKAKDPEASPEAA